MQSKVVKRIMEHLNALKAQGKPLEYAFFPSLGHYASFFSTTPMEIALHWIKQKSNARMQNRLEE